MVGMKISELPAVGTPALTDVFAEVQPATGGTTYQVTFQKLLNLVLANLGTITANQGGTGIPSPTAHALPVAEGSSAFNFLGPLTNGQLLIGSTGADPVPSTITGGAGINITSGAGAITVSVASGALVKFASVTESSLITTSGSIAVTDTVPQNTNGSQIMAITYTPQNVANILEIEVSLQISGLTSSDSQITAALFQDATASAIAAGGSNTDTSGSRIEALVFKKIMTAGTASATTFKVRAGASDGSACYLNGQTATRAYGGVSGSTITIREYAA